MLVEHTEKLVQTQHHCEQSLRDARRFAAYQSIGALPDKDHMLWERARTAVAEADEEVAAQKCTPKDSGEEVAAQKCTPESSQLMASDLGYHGAFEDASNDECRGNSRRLPVILPLGGDQEFTWR